jgi:hypothetical protein
MISRFASSNFEGLTPSLWSERKGVLLLHLNEIGRQGWKGEELKIAKILIGPVDHGMFLPGRNK